MDEQERHRDPRRGLLRVERVSCTRATGQRNRWCSCPPLPARAVELVRLVQRHRHVAAVRCHRRDVLGASRSLASAPPPRALGRSPPDTPREQTWRTRPRRSSSRRRQRTPRCVGRRRPPWPCSRPPRTDAHRDDRSRGSARRPRARHRGADVASLALRIFELTRLALALAERPVVERERSEAPLGRAPARSDPVACSLTEVSGPVVTTAATGVGPPGGTTPPRAGHGRS